MARVDVEWHLVAVAIEYAHAWLRVDPLEHDEVALERFGTGDSPSGSARYELLPVGRGIGVSGHDPEVDGVEVGDDHEAVAPVVDLIFDIGFAGAHHARVR